MTERIPNAGDDMPAPPAGGAGRCRESRRPVSGPWVADEARKVLAPIHTGIVEGVETIDLKRAGEIPNG